MQSRFFEIALALVLALALVRVLTQSVTPVPVLVRTSQSAFYTVESVRTGPESSPLVRSGSRFIAFREKRAPTTE